MPGYSWQDVPWPTYGAPDYTTSNFEIRDDCIRYDGGYPCALKRPCRGCASYVKVARRVLIVLLEALGDILILSPLPRVMKADNPATHITWLVHERCEPLARMNPYVDRVLVYGWDTVDYLRAQSFDLVLGFERELGAATLVKEISAASKVGISLSDDGGGLVPLDERSREITMLDVWNDYRTHINHRSWTEIYFDIAGYSYAGEPYVAEAAAEAKSRVAAVYGKCDEKKVICLNIGGSFIQKVWPDSHWLALSLEIISRGMRVIVMGGTKERDRAERLAEQVRARGIEAGAFRYAPLSLEETCVVPMFSDAMVTGDSFGYHVALLHRLPAIVLFGPSTPAEVSLPGSQNVIFIQSPYLCSPCAQQMLCGGVGGCMAAIEVPDVARQLDTLLAERTGK